MTRSPVALARKAMKIAHDALPAYASPFSKKTFTQHQLFAMLVLQQFFKTDYRGIIQIIRDWSDLREVLGLSYMPHHTTLILRQEASFKNENFDWLLSSIFNDAQELGLIEPKAEASIDATGMEARHVSRHYVLRAGYKRFLRYRWPKLTLVCDNDTHLFAAAVVTDGPSQDSPQFPQAMIQACRHLTIDRLLGDAGYDGEHNHRLARETLSIRSTVIALNKRNSRKWPRTKYRRQMKRRFHCRIFGNRWQVESAISRNKRRLGSALRARTPPSQEQECFLRVITHNLMILSNAA